jgi:hypothetical protein
MEETELEMAQRHVTEGRRIVAEQREGVARLKISSHDFHAAQKDLELFEDSLAIFEADLAAPPRKIKSPEPLGGRAKIKAAILRTHIARASIESGTKRSRRYSALVQ